MFKNKKSQKGFTLIEILIVIGIIAVLATIVIIAINPARQFAQARDTQRISNLNSILNAVGQRLADNRGVFAGTFTIGVTPYTCGPLPVDVANVSQINTTMAADTTTATGNLGCLVPTYIGALPLDPAGVTPPGTGYEIYVESTTGRVHVRSISASEPTIPRTSKLEVVR